MDRMIGIIDIGSNTIRLVIYEIRQSSFHPVDDFKVTARLGKHFDDDGALSETGINILIDTLKSCRKLIQAYDNCEVRCLATAAIRMAKNRGEIIRKIDEKIGFTVEVLEEEKEAYYGCLSATEALSYDRGITIDLGGASTEVTLFKKRKLVQAHSFPFGAVTLQKSYAKGAVIPFEQRLQLRNYLKKELQGVPWLKNVGGIIAGLGGNARQLAQLSTLYEDSVQIEIHAAEIRCTTIARIRTSFGKLNEREIMNIDVLSRERADLMNIVLEVFCAVGEWAGTSRFIVNTRGIREGVLYDMLPSKEAVATTLDKNFRLKERVKLRGTNRLLDRYHVDKSLSKERIQLVQRFLQSFQDAEIINLGRKERFLAEQAAALFYIGQSISKSKRHRTTFSRLMSATFDGYSQKEKLLIVLMASFKSIKSFKNMLQPYKGMLSKKEVRYVRRLGALIKFCNAFIDEKCWITHIGIKQHSFAGLNFQLYVNHHAPELVRYSEKQKKHVEKAFACPVQLSFVDK
ncbi:hypothetical protein ACFSKI_08095 [Pseudogracilibacillus auburnensis]|uniref:Exopolyphosphatase/guanosine-5'-triphosphate, 3'-diphosphate pyrophosphatase n=1 Tax=Pseudogracilibacillus auburnensis TaxID=1494959 RepID=A0A2V3VUU2_9BACI|nr:hypothetical protein [Pseudogracilibacillus auburnensis]PXW84834.1 exopolyphosphatase/guanosine-5'-triphosphate,3'-diphosphate pyrophosphatase [Pseudogracilibacillus auburnensis]